MPLQIRQILWSQFWSWNKSVQSETFTLQLPAHRQLHEPDADEKIRTCSVPGEMRFEVGDSVAWDRAQAAPDWTVPRPVWKENDTETHVCSSVWSTNVAATTNEAEEFYEGWTVWRILPHVAKAPADKSKHGPNKRRKIIPSWLCFKVHTCGLQHSTDLFFHKAQEHWLLRPVRGCSPWLCFTVISTFQRPKSALPSSRFVFNVSSFACGSSSECQKQNT